MLRLSVGVVAQQDESPQPVVDVVADVDWRTAATPTEWKMLQNRIQTKCGARLSELRECTTEEVEAEPMRC